jgi:hypothetical protein
MQSQPEDTKESLKLSPEQVTSDETLRYKRIDNSPTIGIN